MTRSDRLSFIDEGLRQLPKLSEDEARCVRTLNVHSNAISSLSGLEALPRLTSLNLSSNALESFDSGAEALRQLSLTALDFACNRIEDVRGLGDLPALTTLNLSFNRIRTIDGLASGSTLQSLRTLDLRGNRISSARGLRCIARLTALTTLSLQSADGSCANPICAGAEEYRSGVCGIASSLLETLDGRPVVERLEEQSAPPDDDSRGSGGAAAPPRSPPPLMPHFDRLANLRRSGGAAAAGARPRRGDGGGGLELDRRAKLALRLKALQREARREAEDMQRFLADQRGPEAAGAASSAPRRRRRGKAAAKAAGAAASDAAQVEVEERAAADRLEALQREIEGARAEHVASTAALDEHRVATDEAQRAHAEHAAQAHDAIAAARHEASLCEATVHAQRLAAAELERSHRDNADAAAAARSELLANRGLAQRHVVEIERLRAELSTAESVEEQRSEVIGVLSRTVTDNARSAQVLEGELAAAALARSALSGRAEAAEGELRALRDRIGSAERARREIAERGAERTSALEMRAAELAATSQLAQYEREHATAAAADAIEAQLTSADAVQRLTGELRQSRAARSALDAALRAQETAQSEAAQQQEQMVALHAQRSDTRVVRLEGAFEMAARQTAELRHALETSQRLERRKAEGEQLALAGARDIADLAESQRDKLHQLERRLADAATVQARRDAEMLAGAAAAETRAEAAALAMDAAKREQASAAKALRGELQRALAAGAAAEQQRSDLAGEQCVCATEAPLPACRACISRSPSPPDGCGPGACDRRGGGAVARPCARQGGRTAAVTVKR